MALATLCSLLVGSVTLMAPAPRQSEVELIVPPSVQLGDRVANGPNSVAIVWQAPDTERPYTLRFSQGGTARTAKPTFRTIRVEGIAPHRFYSAALKDLTPGKPIAYKLMDGDKVAFSGETMAPKSEKQDYTFAVFGDCGAGMTEEAMVAYQTYRQKPDMLIMTGDLVYGRGRISEYRTKFYPYYTAEIASPKDGAPIFPSTLTVGAAGNHDILHRELDQNPDALAFYYYWNQPLNGPLTQNGAPSTPTLSGTKAHQDAFLAGAGANYPRSANFSYDYGNAHWTVLDSNPYVDWTDPKLRDWVKADLAKGAGKTWRFVIFHHPGFHSSPNHQSEKQMRVLSDLFEDGKVDVVFNGHVHNYQRSFPIQVGPKHGASKEELNQNDWPVDKSYDGTKNTHPKGVVYLVDGAGGNDLYNPELNGHPETWKPFQDKYNAIHSFSIVSVKGRKFFLRQLDKEGNEIDRFTIEK